jgi:tetratricopeptide (TPR) repeat protein
MNEQSLSPHLAHTIERRFIGREEALKVFYSRPAYRSMQNGVYYVGPGGAGKTWILRKIILDNRGIPGLEVLDIIDFYDMRNNNLHGLQEAIKVRLGSNEIFKPYDELIRRFRKERDPKLEDKANHVFIECCQNAIINREIYLLFDTFERVRNRYVGTWLLEKFLPQVRGLIVVLAGRPEPTKTNLANAASENELEEEKETNIPENIVIYRLSGFSEEEAQSYIRNQSSITDPATIQTIWMRTRGLPLLIELILDLHSPLREQFIEKMNKLEPDQTIQKSDELKRNLVGQFAAPVNNRNRIIWAMAYLWRRFDLPMLKYLVDNSGWFQPGDYQNLVDELTRSIYIKESPSEQSHLLHDEIRDLIARYILDEAADPDHKLRNELDKLIVEKYYDQEIKKLDESEAHQLKAEQIGYILDRSFETGLSKYNLEVEKKNYSDDYEELLWGELREHLKECSDNGYQICLQRSVRMRHRALFSQAEDHFRDMMKRFPENQTQLGQSLAYMIFQQGRLEEAITEYDKILSKKESMEVVAQVENNLGQVERASGRWDKALDHFNHGFDAAMRINNQDRMIDILISRASLYSLQGKFDEAISQCKNAITRLEKYPPSIYEMNNFQTIRMMFAYRNLGTVYRHKNDYENALKQYRTSLEYAVELKDETGICEISQHMGITLHLLGRQLRRDNVNLEKALDYQLQAQEFLSTAIESARRADWRSAIANGLNRIAKIYREVYYFSESDYFIHLPLNNALEPEALSLLNLLKQKLSSFDNPFELDYQEKLLIKNKSFAELNWLEKSERLFETSSIIADEVSDHYRAMDSMTETARLLMWLKRPDDAYVVIRRIRRLPGFEIQQDVFTAISNLTLAHLEFIQEKYDSALDHFAGSFTKLAKSSGYASYLLTDRLRDLEWRLRDLDPDRSLQWCETLEKVWKESGAMTQRPDMQDMLERIRLDKYPAANLNTANS